MYNYSCLLKKFYQLYLNETKNKDKNLINMNFNCCRNNNI